MFASAALVAEAPVGASGTIPATVDPAALLVFGGTLVALAGLWRRRRRSRT
jgi:hypothetical protein